MSFKVTEEYVKNLRQELESKDSDLSQIFNEIHAADIAEILTYFTIDEVQSLLEPIKKDLLSSILTYLDESLLNEFLELLSSVEIAELVSESMDTDDAVDIISLLSEEKKHDVLSHVDDLNLAKDLADLLTHAEGTAGALMATELVKVNQNWTVLKCVREMRRQAEGIDVVHAVYVVDDNDILLGSLSLKKLLTTSTKTEISEIFEKSIHSVTSTSEDAEIAKIMKKYDLFVVPVVDEIGRLLGRITLDDAVDIIQEEADSNYQLISGLSDEVSNEDGLFQTTKARLPWLLIGLLGGVLTSTVISENESEITLIPQIVFFIPLIAAMGGNVGVQSSAIVVQALANSTLQKNIWQRLARELGVGLFNGLICSLVIVGYSWAIGQGLLFATAVGSSLLAVVLFASLFGTAIPWILNKYNIDPALATGPFITTTNDVLGLSIYFAIANALL
ncbi:MAG: magnesium transporter [Schleiferiaceae bacterium]|tara:strand:+ start:7666 stop:9009 length:1344 start_codon:yes stop_codon:yes gene_type:complete